MFCGTKNKDIFIKIKCTQTQDNINNVNTVKRHIQHPEVILLNILKCFNVIIAIMKVFKCGVLIDIL